MHQNVPGLAQIAGSRPLLGLARAREREMRENRLELRQALLVAPPSPEFLLNRIAA